MMPERIVLVGLGGIGSQLLPSLVRYVAFRPEPCPMLVLVDGDAYEPANRTRQVFPESAIGSNKAEALAEVYRGLTVQGIADYLTEANVADIIRDGDAVLLAVDNHWTRFVVDKHLATLDEVTLISGGNDETDGNVQLVRRRGGEFVDGKPGRDPCRDRPGHRGRVRSPQRLRATGRGATPAGGHQPDGRIRDAQLPMGGTRARQRVLLRGLPRRDRQRDEIAPVVPSEAA